MVLLLIHVPPVEGFSVVVEPTQTTDDPVILTAGFECTMMALEDSEEHPVALLVKVNVELPLLIAVTTPALFIVATLGLLLVQVPPDEGLSVVV